MPSQITIAALGQATEDRNMIKRLFAGLFFSAPVAILGFLVVQWLWNHKQDAGAIFAVITGFLFAAGAIHAWRVAWCGDKPAAWFRTLFDMLGID